MSRAAQTANGTPRRTWTRHVQVSYLPPLMVYMAAGISGLTAIVSTFFVKDYLGLSAAFLAALGFWAGLPWALKMPLGHLVDLMWRWKAGLVLIGASLITASLGIMLGLIGNRPMLEQYMSAEAWYVLSVLLAPLGYVVQDVVADAMTVEAVPTVDGRGRPYDEQTLKSMHTTMQTLGRVAIVGGGIGVSLLNIVLFKGIETMSEPEQVAVYLQVYQMAMLIPVISVLGVALAAVLRHISSRALRRQGLSQEAIAGVLAPQSERPHADWWLLGGSLIFVVFILCMGMSALPYNQETIFLGSMAADRKFKRMFAARPPDALPRDHRPQSALSGAKTVPSVRRNASQPRVCPRCGQAHAERAHRRLSPAHQEHGRRHGGSGSRPREGGLGATRGGDARWVWGALEMPENFVDHLSVGDRRDNP